MFSLLEYEIKFWANAKGAVDIIFVIIPLSKSATLTASYFLQLIK